MKEKKNLKPFPCTKFCYIFGSNWCTHDPSWHHQILGVGVLYCKCSFCSKCRWTKLCQHI